MKKTNLIGCIVLVVMTTILSAQAQTFTPLHQFDGEKSTEAFPEGSIIRDADGNLYGTTTLDGSVFKITKDGKYSVLTFINGGDGGIFPTGALALDATGNLYGVAEGGPGAGVVYKLSPKGEETVLFSFQGGLKVTKPQLPAGGVLLGNNGEVFGAAQFGSELACKLGCGSLFRLDAAGTLHILHKFSGGADGASPIGPLVQDASGNLYGVAQSGGDHNCPTHFLFPGAGCGVVFKIDSHNVLTVLHTFAGKADGAVPQGGLLLDAAGNLFGTTLKGGHSDNGTIFKIASDGTYTVLRRMTKVTGVNPNGGLVADPAGNLYGTAQLGGNQNLGTAFELTADGKLKVLHNFQGLKDGASPLAGLFRDDAGRLYGTTVHNGLIQRVQGGNVFMVTP
jgi:uncharacterized repeat protein (TIGR03803 family)